MEGKGKAVSDWLGYGSDNMNEAVGERQEV